MKEMKMSENIRDGIENALEHLKEANSHLSAVNRCLESVLVEEEPKDNKVKLTIKVENPYDGIEIDEKDLEEIRKDLEEIINDFTRE